MLILHDRFVFRQPEYARFIRVCDPMASRLAGSHSPIDLACPAGREDPRAFAVTPDALLRLVSTVTPTTPAPHLLGLRSGLHSPGAPIPLSAGDPFHRRLRRVDALSAAATLRLA